MGIAVNDQFNLVATSGRWVVNAGGNTYNFRTMNEALVFAQNAAYVSGTTPVHGVEFHSIHKLEGWR